MTEGGAGDAAQERRDTGGGRRRRGLPGRTPLRVQLVVALVALVAVALLATGAAVTAALRGYLVGQVDQDLRGGADLRGRDLAQRPPGGDVGPRESRQEYVAAVLPGGRVVDLRAGDADDGAPRLPASLPQQTEPFTLPSAGGGADWRVVSAPARTAGGQDVTLVRAISLSQVDQTIRRLVLVEAVGGLVVLLLLGAAGYLVVRSSLRPLEEVEATAEAIAAGDLARRVPDRDPRTEVGRLSRALNGMLVQIEGAFRARESSEVAARASEERMRRFVADASHELRTPLTSIRGFAELYRQGAVPEAADLDGVMRRVEAEAERMGLLVDDLLLLARMDQQRPLERRPVDLLDLARDAVTDARARAPGRRIHLQVSGPHAPVVTGDEARLRQVLGNLVTNALGHTPPETPLVVSVGVVEQDGEGPCALLAVADRGPGIPEPDAARVFERFYRADPSRTREHGGSGLGLSIVSALVAAHGGRVELGRTPGGGATFRVLLPPAGPSPTRG